jgi:XTP/dITP diphosphohydrolase
VKLLLATHNPHKRREFGRLLPGHEVVALPEGMSLPPETGRSFAENALAKARAVARATGEPAIADDSGIEAAALGGAPGIFSARFAGEGVDDATNLAKLRRLAPAGSALRYVCALAYADRGRRGERLFEGSCGGVMAGEARGKRGFGYDPVFVPDAHRDGRTMGELTDAEKDAISHRGRAARQLLAWLGS